MNHLFRIQDIEIFGVHLSYSYQCKPMIANLTKRSLSQFAVITAGSVLPARVAFLPLLNVSITAYTRRSLRETDIRLRYQNLLDGKNQQFA